MFWRSIINTQCQILKIITQFSFLLSDNHRNEDFIKPTVLLFSTFYSLFSIHINFNFNFITHDEFIQCLSLSHPSVPILVENSLNNTAYTAAFLSHARNSRFLSANETRPEVIVNPTQESHVQTAVVCARKYNLDIKVRSGGHDMEGLSYASETPYVMIDLYNYKNITVDIEDNSAWIQAGAQLGELYYRIAEKSKTHGFPAGFCPTVGVGGHISGGGFGALVRKYGLASDQVIDARMVTVDGRIHNRQSMGKDLFWAIRGGGANNFGIILSWKVKLVEVTPIVTVATIDRTLEQGATDLVHKWQYIADRLHEDVYVGLTITTNTSQNGKKTVQASFSFFFLGRTDKLVQLMDESFPELGLKRKDCIEMSWVKSHVYFYARGRPLNVLLDRDPNQKTFMKAKSDFVKEPITKAGLEGIWKRFLADVQIPVMLWTPYGGIMNKISGSENPFPHRVGNIYNILYIATWIEEKDSEANIDWMRRLHKYMTPYVSKSPRAAYLNYKDLDLGQYKNGEVMSYGKAKAWGSKYFLNNFNRLVKVKSMVDPDNFFNNKQSIPPIKSWGHKKHD